MPTLDHQLENIELNLDDLGSQLDECLATDDIGQHRNRKAIEVHGKLDDVNKALKALRDQVETDHQRQRVEIIRRRLVGMARTLLEQIFVVDTTQMPDLKDVPPYVPSDPRARPTVTVRVDDEVYELVEQRRADLQGANPRSRVTFNDAVRDLAGMPALEE